MLGLSLHLWGGLLIDYGSAPIDPSYSLIDDFSSPNNEPWVFW